MRGAIPLIRPARVLGMVILLTGCAAARPMSATLRPSGIGSPVPPTTAAPPTTTATTPAPITTTTTVDPGLLPQTRQLPSSQDPAFLARMQGLWQAVVQGNPDLAMPAFFPLTAYLQVKALPNPASDWQYRLVAMYRSDLLGLHRAVAAETPAGGNGGNGGDADNAELVSVTVPAAAVWINPGIEYNKIGYWRVYDTVVRYEVENSIHNFIIVSLISWRGQWYVVHLTQLPR